jgi:dolichyldiphosphatase
MALAGAGAVGASRVYLQYHTPKQVLAGAGAGAACALAWFVATDRLRAAGGVGWLLGTRLARAFRFRDLLLHEDPVQAGWEKWQRKRAATTPTAITNDHNRGAQTALSEQQQ